MKRALKQKFLNSGNNSDEGVEYFVSDNSIQDKDYLESEQSVVV